MNGLLLDRHLQHIKINTPLHSFYSECYIFNLHLNLNLISSPYLFVATIPSFVMLLERILLPFIISFLAFTSIQAQFGISKNTNAEADADVNPADASAANELDINIDAIAIDDPELSEAIQMFAGMSPEEMMQTMEELKEILGNNDPAALQEIEEVMLEIAKLDLEGDYNGVDTNALKDLMGEDRAAMAMSDTLDMLRNADEGDWNKILENKEQILEVVIQSGVMDEDEVEMFRNDPGAWEEELRFIWEELKNQADEDANGGGGGVDRSILGEL